jgi:hypothetical protein
MQTGNHISFKHSFPDGEKQCFGIVSHIYNSGQGLVAILNQYFLLHSLLGYTLPLNRVFSIFIFSLKSSCLIFTF